MKKIFLIIFSLIFISSSFMALSLFSAQDISKKYLSENEMIDSFTQPKIVCDSQEYFVIPIINSLGEPVLFVPVSVKEGDLFISKTDSFNVSLIKTEYLIKLLNNSDPGNYLSLQLIDRISSLTTSLNSKKSQLSGLLQKEYSFPVKQQLTVTINKLDILIIQLNDLKESSSTLLSSQNSFLSKPDCQTTSTLINSFEDAFIGYDKISQSTTEYIQASDLLITRIVADNSIPAQEINSIMSIASPISNLNSQVNLIYESFSSTSSFYQKISNLLRGDQKIKIFIDNLSSRRDMVVLNDLLTRYDSTFPNYSNLDSVVKTITDDKYKDSWVEKEEALNVLKIYNEIKEHRSKAQYSQAITKVSTLKSKSLKVIEAGLLEETEDIDNTFYYIFIGFILLVLIIFSVIISRKKSKPLNYKKPKQKNQEDIFNYKDPF